MLFISLFIVIATAVDNAEYHSSFRVFKHIFVDNLDTAGDLADEIEIMTIESSEESQLLTDTAIMYIIDELREVISQATQASLQDLTDVSDESRLDPDKAMQIASFMPKFGDISFRIYQHIPPNTDKLKILRMKVKYIWMDWLRWGRAIAWIESESEGSLSGPKGKQRAHNRRILHILEGVLRSLMFARFDLSKEYLPIKKDFDFMEIKSQIANLNQMIGNSLDLMERGGPATSTTNICIAMKTLIKLFEQFLAGIPLKYEFGMLDILNLRSAVDLQRCELKFILDELELIAREFED